MHRILEGSFRNKIFHTRLKLSFTAVHTKFALVMELPKIFSTAVTLSSYYCSCPDFHCIQTESSSVPSGTLLIPRFLKDITAVSHFTACAFSCVCNTKLSQQSQWCHWQPPRFSLQKLSFLQTWEIRCFRGLSCSSFSLLLGLAIFQYAYRESLFLNFLNSPSCLLQSCHFSVSGGPNTFWLPCYQAVSHSFSHFM